MRRAGAPWLVALMLSLGACVNAAPDADMPTRATVAAVDPRIIGGRGARVPFVEYEAENGWTDGTPIGPDRRFGTLAAEASGRRAVRIEGDQSVGFTLGAEANAITVRYALPDGADGRGRDAMLDVLVDGVRVGAMPVTSRYGHYYGAYPFTNDPGDGKGHHFFDHARLKLDRTIPAGARVSLRMDRAGAALWIAIDLADFETVAPPAPMPDGALSLAGFDVDPIGVRDSGAGFRRAVEAAQQTGRVLWIPPGTYRVEGHVVVDRVTIAGSGMWHSVLRGKGLGLYGKEAPNGSQAVHLRDFAILGEVDERVDTLPLSGIGGAMGGGSTIERLWLQHHKVGLWFDGPMRGIRISGLRIFDMTADGLNFHRGVRDAEIADSFIRGTGDDALAAWSGGVANSGIAFRNNTVIAPVLANGIAVYGGSAIVVAGNVVADTLTQGGGIHFGNRFKAEPLSGRIDVTDNLLLRAGTFDPNWRHGVGALWFYALDRPIDADIRVAELEVRDSSEEAVLFTGSRIEGVSIAGMRVAGGGGPVVTLRSEGAATMRDVTVSGVEGAAVLRCHAGFALALGPGTAGMLGTATGTCGPR